MDIVTIARRYRGPLDSANGGYAAGLLGGRLGADGRKVFAGTALFGRGGELLARARQVWIAPRPA